MVTLTDEYKEVAEFARSGYYRLYDVIKICLALNAAFIAIIGYAVTNSASQDPIAVALRLWGFYAVPVLGIVVGLIASIAHWRLVEYVKAFFKRGSEIEGIVNAPPSTDGVGRSSRCPGPVIIKLKSVYSQQR